MTEHPGAIPMGRAPSGGRSILHDAVETRAGFSCPLHADGIVTKSGTIYECDEGHGLLGPNGPQVTGLG